jgi:hypothetical protein
MNKFIVVVMAFLAYGQVSYAQNEVRDMNAIKNNQNYIYATGTSIVNTEEASQNAKDLLNAEIEDWLTKNKESDIAGYIAKSQEQLGLIKTQRGNLFRVFAYVHKADILPYYKDETVITGSFNDKLVSENRELSDTVTVDVSQDTTILETSSSEKQDTLVERLPQSVTQAVEKPKYIPNDKEKELLNIKTFIELNEYINEGRENENIVQVGKYSTLPTDGIIYVFIHNREGEIPACMKMENGYTLNLSTGEEDYITSYKGCGAIWIKFK